MESSEELFVAIAHHQRELFFREAVGPSAPACGTTEGIEEMGDIDGVSWILYGWDLGG